MMLPVTRFEDIAAMGWGERRAVDLKVTYSGTEFAQRVEIAKDIAAFANGVGGVILVGAKEVVGSEPLWIGLAEDHCATLKHEFECAARDRCRPAVLVDALPLFGPQGKRLLAVSVFPASLGVVGVVFRKSEFGIIPKDDPRSALPEDFYSFPMRAAGSLPHALRPESFGMLANDTVRRVAALLQQVPVNEREQMFLQVANWQVGEAQDKRLDLKLSDVDLITNSVVVEVRVNQAFDLVQRLGKQITEWRKLVLPIDAFQTVWKEGRYWVVLAPKLFLEMSGSSDATWRLE